MSTFAGFTKTPRFLSLVLGLGMAFASPGCSRDEAASRLDSDEEDRPSGLVDTSRLGDSARSIVDRLHYDARFVTGDQLDVLDHLLGRPSQLTRAASEREIYLLLRVQATESLKSKRVLRATFELTSPAPIDGIRFGFAGSLYRDDGIYAIEKLVSAGNVMTDASRHEILAATPRLVMTDVYLK